MLGDASLQKSQKINALFVTKLVPAMRRQGVKRFLYQAGGFTRRCKESHVFGDSERVIRSPSKCKRAA